MIIHRDFIHAFILIIQCTHTQPNGHFLGHYMQTFMCSLLHSVIYVFDVCQYVCAYCVYFAINVMITDHCRIRRAPHDVFSPAQPYSRAAMQRLSAILAHAVRSSVPHPPPSAVPSVWQSRPYALHFCAQPLRPTCAADHASESTL